MAAKRPMMATTIMISTKVKPDLLNLLIFILAFFDGWVSKGATQMPESRYKKQKSPKLSLRAGEN
jgi:hypothetical protein